MLFRSDLNLELMMVLMKWLKLPANWSLTENYREPDATENDLRGRWNNSTVTKVDGLRYFQVFSDKHGFQPGLSTLDLIFNTGPEAATLLLKL